MLAIGLDSAANNWGSMGILLAEIELLGEEKMSSVGWTLERQCEWVGIKKNHYYPPGCLPMCLAG